MRAPSGPSIETKGQRFAQMPEALLYDRSITPLAKVIYLVLLRHGDRPETCFPSHARIAELLDVSERSVNRPLSALEKAGWITRVRRGAERSCSYIVHSDDLDHRAPERGHDDAKEADRAEERGVTAPRSAVGPRSTARLKRAIEREQSNEESQNLAPTGVVADVVVDEEMLRLGRLAQDLSVLAFEQPIKPVIRNRDEDGKPAKAFVAVRGLILAQLKAGRPAGELEAAIRAGVTVWSTGGLATAIAQSRSANGRRYSGDGTSAVLDELEGLL